MTQKFPKKIKKYQDLLIYLITITLYGIMIFITIPNVVKYAHGLEIMDLMPGGYATSYANKFLATIGKQGRNAYIMQLFVDTFYPGMFGFSFYKIISYLTKKNDTKSTKIVYVPFFASLFDYLENLSILSLIIIFPSKNNLIEDLLPYFTLLKSIFYTISYLIAIFFIIKIIGSKFLIKKRQSTINIL